MFYIYIDWPETKRQSRIRTRKVSNARNPWGKEQKTLMLALTAGSDASWAASLALTATNGKSKQFGKKLYFHILAQHAGFLLTRTRSRVQTSSWKCKHYSVASNTSQEIFLIIVASRDTFLSDTIATSTTTMNAVFFMINELSKSRSDFNWNTSKCNALILASARTFEFVRNWRIEVVTE